MIHPLFVAGASFQEAWIKLASSLAAKGWVRRNAVVQIKDPELLDTRIHEAVTAFALENDMLGPKDVAYTIFPHRLYNTVGTASDLFRAYHRRGGLYERLQRRSGRWGTYFGRMTAYPGMGGPVNQLENIIDSVNRRHSTHTSAYTIVVQRPGRETVRPRGGPCLNYIAVQLSPGHPRSLGLLAVYRNQDILERGYGNYWGLCNLLLFLATETHSQPGSLTCVVSHAYVESRKRALRQLLSRL